MTDLWPEFSYDETSPTFLRWAVDVRTGWEDSVLLVSAGDVAGTEGRRGIRVKLNYKTVSVHRIVYEKFFGKLEDGCVIDHIDGDFRNNRKDNLRSVTTAVNNRNKKKARNNKSGVTGVCLERRKAGDYWRADVKLLCGKRKTKSFAVLKHGYDAARDMAVREREKMLADLNASEAGYTERHGS